MMKLYTRILAGLVLSTLLLAGCGQKNTSQVDIEPGDAAAVILEGVDFKDSLVLAEGDVAKGYYELDDKITGYAVYISGSGGTAEEIAVLKVAGEADAPHAEEIVRSRWDTLKVMFENYRPDEMAKLGDAVVEVRGNVVYFVTADDPAQAKAAIDSLYA